MQIHSIKKPIEIKIVTVVAVAVMLHSTDLAAINTTLQQMTGDTADFFDNEFAVIDVGNLDLSSQSVNWVALINLLKGYRLNPMAVRNAPIFMHDEIAAFNLSIDHVAPARPDAQMQQQEVIEEPAITKEAVHIQTHTPPPAPEAMIIDTPVRAGQRIYARGTDLIITAAVNSGAEVIADGSIHIYAPLRGRALAGARGNTDARIFAMAMEPELVSIAGVYRTFDNGFPKELKKHPSQVRLIGDKIDITTFNLKTAIER